MEFPGVFGVIRLWLARCLAIPLDFSLAKFPSVLRMLGGSKSVVGEVVSGGFIFIILMGILNINLR